MNPYTNSIAYLKIKGLADWTETHDGLETNLSHMSDGFQIKIVFSILNDQLISNFRYRLPMPHCIFQPHVTYHGFTFHRECINVSAEVPTQSLIKIKDFLLNDLIRAKSLLDAYNQKQSEHFKYLTERRVAIEKFIADNFPTFILKKADNVYVNGDGVTIKLSFKDNEVYVHKVILKDSAASSYKN